ncbi:hypothetical protein JG687_00017497 [Phytophthora cactorum]|uniref:Uncharacterized protein n=1 Tax=Phytophthora cactorum TaxID=29920 RepID=A0A8T1TR77_9STRA|nr:hypothetical protein GQ600_9219 [Phytophthora cactorum]KAG6945083.1 hypothetical protein JG687_00017497 [Phytophthora cactorum]
MEKLAKSLDGLEESYIASQYYVSVEIFSVMNCAASSPMSLKCCLKHASVVHTRELPEDVRLEAHIHALIRHQESFCFTFHKYTLTDLDDIEESGTITSGRLIYGDQDKLRQVKRQGENLAECVLQTLPRWITGFPQRACAGRLLLSYDTPNADAPVDRYCIVHLTRATTHKCGQNFLWKLAQPIVKQQLPVCYVALQLDDGGDSNKDNKIAGFRLNFTKNEILRHIALYVATYDKFSNESTKKHALLGSVSPRGVQTWISFSR